MSPGHFSPYNWRLSKIFGSLSYSTMSKKVSSPKTCPRQTVAEKCQMNLLKIITYQVISPVKIAYLFNQA